MSGQHHREEPRTAVLHEDVDDRLVGADQAAVQHPEEEGQVVRGGRDVLRDDRHLAEQAEGAQLAAVVLVGQRQRLRGKQADRYTIVLREADTSSFEVEVTTNWRSSGVPG